MTPAPYDPEHVRDLRIFRTAAIVIATAAAAYVLWLLVDLLLLLFACGLMALILLTGTAIIRRHLRMPFGAGLALTVALLLGIVGGASWFFGATMRDQFNELVVRLPAAWAAVQAQLEAWPIGASLVDRARQLAPSGQTIVDAVTTVLTAVGGIVSGLVIVLVGGLYLAAQPRLYEGGMLKLLPASVRPRAEETMEAVTTSLKGWLKGQALGMIFVGIGTTIALMIVGVPAAGAIGLVAGLAEFVPYAGSIVAGIPAIILGFSQGTETGLWTIAALVLVQQVQGNLVMPLLQNRMVELPPALTIFGIIAAGLLLGPVGVLLATPLTVVVLVLVRRLYLREDDEELLADNEPKS